MKALTKLVLAPLVLLLVTAPAMQALAQQSEFKPAVVVSVASYDEVFGDISYLAEAAGVKEYVDAAAGFAGVLTDGLDKKRPSGAYVMVSADGSEPQPVVFIPVTDLERLLKTHEGNIGPAEKEGDLRRIDTPNGESVYIKESAGWAFASRDKDALALTPGDPTTLLGGLDKEYTVAVKVMVQNIPVALRAMAVDQMKAGFEAQLAEMAKENPDDREVIEKIGRRQIEAIQKFIEDSDEVVIGWAVDSVGKNTYIDLSMTAKAGSDLAAQFAQMGDGKSAFSGFLMSDAAGAFHFGHLLSKDEIDQLTPLIDGANKKAVEAIEEDEDLDSDAQRKAAKDIVSSLFSAARKTVASGKLNGGATVMLGDQSLTFVAGGHVAGAAELDHVLRVGADLAKNEPDFPGIKFDADKHAGVTFHTMSVPLDDEDAEDARKVFGDNLDVAFGVGQDSFYLAVGKDGVSTLKRVIDDSAAGADQKRPPSEMFIALAPILKFAASISDDEVVPLMASSAEKVRGNDRISITSTVIERGSRSRIQIDEGVLKLIGEVGMKLSGAGPR